MDKCYMRGVVMLFSFHFNNDCPLDYRISSITLFDDINAVEIGYSRAPKGLQQIMKRDVYILHYITKGSGEFCGKKFKEGNCYIVVPNQLENITADKDNSYEAYWIMFKGKTALDFLKKCNLPCHNDVFEFPKTNESCEILHNALYNIRPTNEYEEAAIMNSALHQIMALHFGVLPTMISVDNVARKVMKFINANYYNNITIDSIAKSFGFSRNYLYTLFKNDYGISPQTHLLNLRIEKAKELLLAKQPLSINEIAISVGYQDALYFSRVFHKKVGVSPTEFEKAHKKQLT